MKFKVFSELSYEVTTDTTFIFNIQAAKTTSQTVISESLTINPYLHFEEFKLLNNQTRFLKLKALANTIFTVVYEAVVDVELKLIEVKNISKVPIISLPHEVLPYIAPSRHCESDKIWYFAIEEFGSLPTQYEKVLAINKWIFENVKYEPGTTNASASASDTFYYRLGVCKDFAHLAIAFCRALDIPARYFTGYANNLNPPDFHACYEVFIGGNWLFFDPTQKVSPDGLVKIACGKDASEVPIASCFGETVCTYLNTQCSTLNNDDTLTEDFLQTVAVSYGE